MVLLEDAVAGVSVESYPLFPQISWRRVNTRPQVDIIEPLAKKHDRSDFTCDDDRIDSYFREVASQDVKRKYRPAREIAKGRVAGFYTLSSRTCL